MMLAKIGALEKAKVCWEAYSSMRCHGVAMHLCGFLELNMLVYRRKDNNTGN